MRLLARVTDSLGASAEQFVDITVTPYPPVGRKYMVGLTAPEIQALPDPREAPLGTPAANVLRWATTGNPAAELDLSSGGISQLVGAHALASALMFVFLGGRDPVLAEWHRSRVTAYLQRWTEWSGEMKYSNIARKLSGAVMCADLVDHFPPAWMDFLDRLRYQPLVGHSRWPDLYTTAWECPNNHGTNARGSYLAASLFIGDDAAVQASIGWTKAWLGDTSEYRTWQDGQSRTYGGLGPIGGNDAASWCELGYIPSTPDLWAPVNRVTGDPTRDGGQPMELYREGTSYSVDGNGVPIWGGSGGQYQGTALVGAVADLVLIEWAGHDPWHWADNAALRARQYMYRWGPGNLPYTSDPLTHGGRGVSHESVFGWIDAVFNAKYTATEREGVVFPCAADRGYGLSFTDWLYGP